jgi:hypothetical protein
MNIGSVALFLIFMLFVATYKTVEHKRRVFNAEATATEIAHGVAEGDSEVTLAWASGKYIDPWGNAFVLITNDHDSGVMIASRGPDREWGTKDDIQSHICDVTYPDRIFIKLSEPKKKLTERVKEKSSGVIDKVKELFSRDKEVPDESDVRDDQT